VVKLINRIFKEMKPWVQAARLRTLPLSMSGIILGAFLAHSYQKFDGLIFLFALFTTISLQVLSNFANDYGDGVKGTDAGHRIGPKRALQIGAISPKQMLRGVYISAIIAFLFAVILIYLSFGVENFKYSICFLVLGILSIVASIKYTVGKNPYGYYGLGDVFVFLFFGLLSVLGSLFLFVRQFEILALLPAFTLGFLSVGVLNVNNMRDSVSDRLSNKNTLVVKMGDGFAKKYHYCLLILAFVFALTYVLFNYKSPFQFIYLISFIPITSHFITIYKNNDPKKLDPELKKLALSTFLFSVLFGLGQIL